MVQGKSCKVISTSRAERSYQSLNEHIQRMFLGDLLHIAHGVCIDDTMDNNEISSYSSRMIAGDRHAIGPTATITFVVRSGHL